MTSLRYFSIGVEWFTKENVMKFFGNNTELQQIFLLKNLKAEFSDGVSRISWKILFWIQPYLFTQYINNLITYAKCDAPVILISDGFYMHPREIWLKARENHIILT